MNAKWMAGVVVIGGVMLSGCLQTKLMSENQQERMAALSQLSNDEDLERVIIGAYLTNPSDNSFVDETILQKKPSYPIDVKKAAVDKLYANKNRKSLLCLCQIGKEMKDAYRYKYIYNQASYKAVDKIDGEIATYIKSKFSTEEDWDFLFKTLQSYEISLNFDLNSNEKFLVWALRNEHTKGLTCNIEHYFCSDITVNGRSTGACIVDEYVKTIEVLHDVAKDLGIGYEARIAAALKLLRQQQLQKDVIVSTVGSFSKGQTGIHDDEIRKIAEAGIAALTRIGADAEAQAIKDRYSEEIGTAKAVEELEKKYAAFWRNVGAVESFFAEANSSVDFVGAPKADKGDLFCYDGWYRFNGSARMEGNPHLVRVSAGGSECNVVVKQVVDGGIIVGRDSLYDVRQESKFPNRIFIKTNKQYADGTALEKGMLLKYIGIKN